MSKALTAPGRLFNITRITANSVIGLGNPENKGAQHRESGFFVLVLWRAVRGRPFGLPGSFVPVYQPAHSSPPSRLVTKSANSKNTKEFLHV